MGINKDADVFLKALEIEQLSHRSIDSIARTLGRLLKIIIKTQGDCTGSVFYPP